jgi:hypothetical protein
MSSNVTLDRTKVEEIGRDGIVDWKKGNLTNTLSLRQLEYGNIEFFRKLANKGSSVNSINFSDMNASTFDIAGYQTDDSGTFLGTVWYPKQRMAGFTINIGDPDSLVERSFNIVGDSEITLQNDNKYLIFKTYSPVAGLNATITISDPVPAADPDNSGKYLFTVVRHRAGVSTELEHEVDWSYNGVDTLTINGTTSTGDLIKVFYSGASYIAGANVFTNNDIDVEGIHANSCSIYLASSNYLYRVQSCSIDVAYDRFDVREVGNRNIAARGTRDTTVTVSIGRIVEAYTIEEVLRGKAGLSYGVINPDKFGSNYNLIVKFYSDDTKATFLSGIKLLDLAATGIDNGVSLNDYQNRTINLTGELGVISSNEASIA